MGKWRINLSEYGAHLQNILLLFMFIITGDPVKQNGAKFTEELRIVVLYVAPYFLTMGLQRAPESRTGTASIFNIIPQSQQKLQKV
jgi:hypothetical protein